MNHRRQYRIGRIHATHQVRQRNTDPHRATIGMPRHTHDAPQTLDDLVVGCPAVVGTVLAKPRNRTVNNIWLNFRAGVIIKSIFLHVARHKVFYHNIALCHHGPHDFGTIRMAQIEGNTAFVAVDTQIIGALTPHKRRPPGSRIITHVGLLDFDDIGAHVTQHLRTIRPRQGPGQIKHA